MYCLLVMISSLVVKSLQSIVTCRQITPIYRHLSSNHSNLSSVVITLSLPCIVICDEVMTSIYRHLLHDSQVSSLVTSLQSITPHHKSLQCTVICHYIFTEFTPIYRHLLHDFNVSSLNLNVSSFLTLLQSIVMCFVLLSA